MGSLCSKGDQYEVKSETAQQGVGGVNKDNGSVPVPNDKGDAHAGEGDVATKADEKPAPQEQRPAHLLSPDGKTPAYLIPANEEQRLETLKATGLSEGAEKRFDDITKLCMMIFNVPLCLVTLIETDRAWFKSGPPGFTESERKSSFCCWTLLPAVPTVMVVENALADVRFVTNPFVIGFPHIRFYAGTPLVAQNGHKMGALCLIDVTAREFTAENCTMLANFGEMVVREIEKERMIQDQKLRNEELAAQQSKLVRAMNSFSEAIMLCDFAQPSWPIMFINEAWESATGLKKDEVVSTSFWQWFKVLGNEDMADKTRAAYSQAVENQQNFNMTVTYVSGSYTALMLQFRCANNSTLDSYMTDVAVRATQGSSTEPATKKYYYTTISHTMENRNGIESNTSSALSGSRIFSLEYEKAAFEDVTLGTMLGYGSFGRVYRGQWNGAPVAIKILEHSASSDGLEALLSSQVSHPNVVRTFKHCTRQIPMAKQIEMGESLVETWMIMEFCNKGTLSDAVECGLFRRFAHDELDYKSLLRTAKEVAASMCYLHTLDILHGDLTGSNILLCTSDGDSRGFVAKVADFGFSRVLNNGDVKTKSYGAISHTPPELLISGLLSKAVDVYAFGVVLWEMYMGQRPYGGLTQAQVINHISNRRGLSLSRDCPPPLSKFITKCSSPKPEERPTFAQILTELETLEEELC